MGYDIHGDKPATPEGQYFGRSSFVWADVVHVVEAVASDESRACGQWYGHDCYGNGLDAGQSRQLAAKLDQALQG